MKTSWKLVLAGAVSLTLLGESVAAPKRPAVGKPAGNAAVQQPRPNPAPPRVQQAPRTNVPAPTRVQPQRTTPTPRVSQPRAPQSAIQSAGRSPKAPAVRPNVHTPVTARANANRLPVQQHARTPVPHRQPTQLSSRGKGTGTSKPTLQVAPKNRVVGKVPSRNGSSAAKIPSITPPRPLVTASPFVQRPGLTDGQKLTGQFFAASGSLAAPAAAALAKAIDGQMLSAGEVDVLQAEQESNPVLQTPVAEAAMSAVLGDQRSLQTEQSLLALGTLAKLGTGTNCGLPACPDRDNSDAPQIVETPPEITQVKGDERDETSPSTGETGLRIVQVLEAGAAEQADLRANDVLYSVDGKRVRNYDEFRAAVQGSKGAVEVVFFNAETKKYEKLEVTPQGGLLGVAVIETELPE